MYMTHGEEKIIDAFKKKDWQEIQSADSWNIFKIMSEFVEGYEKLARIGPCVSIFGSARTEPGTKFYKLAEEIAYQLTQHGYGVITGGGPGIMEATNRGAWELGAKSIGLNITLPFEQVPNPYITPELCFQFHYFAIRKMHLLMRARTLVAFPGGFGTLDELFETLTLIQTGKVRRIPVLLFGREFWERVIDFQVLVDEGTIAAQDVNLFRYVDTAEEAWEVIAQADEEDRQNGNSRERPGAT